MKKNKLLNLLLISSLSGILLACNSGTSSSQPSTTTTPPTQGGNFVWSALEFVGTKIASMAVSDYMAANGISAGTMALNTESYPILNTLYQATGNGTGEILAGLSNLSNQLTQDTLLLEIQQQKYYQSLMAIELNNANATGQYTIDTLITNVNTVYMENVLSWLDHINPNKETPTMTSIFQGLTPESTFSTTQTQALLDNINTFPFQTTNDLASSLVDAGFALGMDATDAKYDWTKPISAAQAQAIASSYFNEQLQQQESQYTSQNPVGVSGSNSFVFYKQWSDALDIQYAQILNTLLQIGAIDQLRVFIAGTSQKKNGKSAVTIPAYIPNTPDGNLPSVANMESDVAYAMQYRIANLTIAIQQSKARIYNYYIGTIASPSLSTSCKVNPATFLSITESQVPTTIGSWDGSTLTVNCQENNGNVLSSSYDVSTLCTTATGTNPISTIGQGGYYTYPNMTESPNNYNLYVWNGNVSCGLQNWETTTFNNSSFTPDINTINVLGTANTDREDRGELQNSWNGVLTWGSYLPIASPIINTTSSTQVGVSTATAFNIASNYNQSISINGYTTGFTPLPNVTGGMLIFDGAHAYMTVVYNNQSYYANVGIQCLPNDNTCSMGNTNGTSYSLNFTNGDNVTIENIGYTAVGSNPWFWVSQNYSVVPAPYNTSN